jgi:hypothetical protein
MLYRNLLATETEEVLAQPSRRRCGLDGRLLARRRRASSMGAIPMDLPMIYFPCGPMLTARCARPNAGLGERCLEVLDGTPVRGTTATSIWQELRELHRSFARPLHDHGDRLDDDRRVVLNPSRP